MLLVRVLRPAAPKRPKDSLLHHSCCSYFLDHPSNAGTGSTHPPASVRGSVTALSWAEPTGLGKLARSRNGRVSAPCAGRDMSFELRALRREGGGDERTAQMVAVDSERTVLR
jgi:hypothetical protein